MSNDTIVQFVCFTTLLEPEEFIALWEPYAKLLVDKPANIQLQKTSSKKAGHRLYVSQHTSGEADFSFAFIKAKSRAQFPEHKAKITQAGGYTLMQFHSPHNRKNNDVKIIAFVPHGETELDFYKGQSFHHLKIYEAYFENCMYGYVMEFFLQEQEAPALLAQLKEKPGVEAALYKECSVAKSSKKMSRYSL